MSDEKSYRITKANGEITKTEIPKLKEKVYFIRVSETSYKKIMRLAEAEERTITVVANRIVRNGLALEHEA